MLWFQGALRRCCLRWSRSVGTTPVIEAGPVDWVDCGLPTYLRHLMVSRASCGALFVCEIEHNMKTSFFAIGVKTQRLMLLIEHGAYCWDFHAENSHAPVHA